jgi:hypothetical protein
MMIMQGGTLYHGGRFVADTTTCRWCGKGTHNETRECDPCWELRWRIEGDPELARKMLAELTPVAA